MKKLLFIFTFLISLTVFCGVYAEEEYLVKVKDSEISLAENIEGLEPVVKEWRIFKISESDLDTLNESMIEYIESDYDIKLADFIPNDPGYLSNQVQYMNMIKVPYAWDNGFFGNNVRVAVLDTGVDLNHPDIAGSIVDTADYTGSGTIKEVSPHGTSVSGVVAAGINNGIGVAGVSKADVVMLKVVHSTGKISNVLAAMYDAVTKYDCKIINLSLTFTSSSGEIPTDQVKSFNDAVDEVYEKGAIVIAAAGNDAKKGNPKSYPASCDHVISVAAVDKNEEWADFSCYNDMVDVAAPGVSLYLPVDTESHSSGYGFASGTSFASPHVAAVAAMLMGQYPDMTCDDFADAIAATSKDLGEEGRDDKYGYGLLNVEGLFDYFAEKYGAVSVESVSLNKESITLKVGETETLTATVLPEDATNKNVTWESSDESIATVEDGVVTAKAAGTAIITVTTEDGNKTDECTVEVTPSRILGDVNGDGFVDDIDWTIIFSHVSYITENPNLPVW